MTTHAGRHLLIDFYECTGDLSLENILDVLTTASRATGATVMFSHAHPFDGGGSSGVIILAESHATYHHWVDERYVALDIFVCGICHPDLALPILEESLKPGWTKITRCFRGEHYQGNPESGVLKTQKE